MLVAKLVPVVDCEDALMKELAQCFIAFDCTAIDQQVDLDSPAVPKAEWADFVSHFCNLRGRQHTTLSHIQVLESRCSIG